MSPKKIKWSLCGAGLAALGAWVFLSGEAPVPARAPAVSAAGSGAAVAHPSAAISTPPQARASVLPPAQNFRSLMWDYANSQGLRAFVDAALKRPAEGGLTYAYAAFEACYGELHGPKGASLTHGHPSAGEAKAKLLARCDLSPDERSDTLAALLVAKKEFLGTDPVLALTFDYLRSQDPKRGLVKYINGMLDTQNIFGMYAVLSTDPQTSQSSQGLGYYFDGVQYLDEASKRRLEDAFIFTTCSYGAPCGTESVTALRLCADRGWCGSDVQSALSAGYAQQNAGEDFLKLAARLGQAFRNKEASAFLR